MRVKRCLAILPLIFLPFVRVWASPIYSPSRLPRMLGGLWSREKPNVGLQIGMPVVMTITVPPPVRTPEAAVQESTVTLPCGFDPSPSPDRDLGGLNPTSVKQPPFESNSPGAFVPVPSEAEQDSMTTIHISTTVTEYVTLPLPTASTPALQPDSQPPILTPSPATAQFTAIPSSSSITSNSSVPLIPTPEGVLTDSATFSTTSTLSIPVPVSETTIIVDTDPETPSSDDSGPAIEIIPVS